MKALLRLPSSISLPSLFGSMLLGMVLTACQTTYLPPVANVPLMSEGDELQTSLHIGPNGYSAQVAYSPYYRWMIFANGQTFANVQDTNFAVKYKHYYGDIGTGVYTRLNKYWRGEVLGGVGFGSTGLPDEVARYRRVFVQPSLGVSGPVLDAAFTPRFALVLNYQNRLNGVVEPATATGAFFEPVVTVRLGYENMKFQLQGGFSIPMGTTTIPYRASLLTLGVHLTLVKDFERYEYSYD